MRLQHLLAPRRLRPPTRIPPPRPPATVRLRGRMSRGHRPPSILYRGGWRPLCRSSVSCSRTYNRRDLVSHAVRSVLAQSFTDLEVVVFDNDSTDGTADVIVGI